MVVFESAIFWIVVAAASEIIALTPLKSNSVIQLVLLCSERSKAEKDLNDGVVPQMYFFWWSSRSRGRSHSDHQRTKILRNSSTQD